MLQQNLFGLTKTKNSSLVGNLEFDSAFKYEMHNDNLSANLTEMAKPFGKRVNDWFKQQNVQEYLKTLQESITTQHCNTPLYETRVGNSEDSGTWSNNDLLTIEFARWLSVEFSIWCNSKIKELLTQGHAEINREMDDSEFLIALVKNDIDLTREQNYQLIALNRPNIKLPKHICKADLTPTEFGNKYLHMEGSCGKKVNLILKSLGYIDKKIKHNGKSKWYITPKGEEYLSEVVGTDGVHKQICIKYCKKEDLADILIN